MEEYLSGRFSFWYVFWLRYNANQHHQDRRYNHRAIMARKFPIYSMSAFVMHKSVNRRDSNAAPLHDGCRSLKSALCGIRSVCLSVLCAQSTHARAFAMHCAKYILHNIHRIYTHRHTKRLRFARARNMIDIYVCSGT